VVVVGVDGSPGSRTALEFAAQQATQLIATLLARQLDVRGISATVTGKPTQFDPIVRIMISGTPYRVLVWSDDEQDAKTVVERLVPPEGD